MVAKSATEVKAELERRKREDPAYRAELERVESERAERARLNRIAEQPVVADLKALGLDLDSVWDLYKIPDSRPQAIPVLLRHLALDYPERVLEGIGQGLDHPSARAWWGDLRDMMLDTERDVVRDRLSAALSNCATRGHYEELLGFIRDDGLGQCRIYFLRPINRIGNRIEAGQGRAVIESVAADPVLANEATAILKGRSRSQ
ncbi:hypothetical protein SAMN05660662_1062 [Blastococcus aurantiacus]|uniref:HEAT repeat-containing protein n=1 Tax=Blastococcus aurantiacus TaxID=1550231 RepID=A0A1G7I8P6_9ACTN|nr:hypothetical protein [Blastococcus aurantiacus]SDF09080.1 hypothetical protein SAMN05660662_1062 [Blastococcus aurantiacus]